MTTRSVYTSSLHTLCLIGRMFLGVEATTFSNLVYEPRDPILRAGCVAWKPRHRLWFIGAEKPFPGSGDRVHPGITGEFLV